MKLLSIKLKILRFLNILLLVKYCNEYLMKFATKITENNKMNGIVNIDDFIMNNISLTNDSCPRIFWVYNLNLALKLLLANSLK